MTQNKITKEYLKEWAERKTQEGLIPTVKLLIEELEECPEGHPDCNGEAHNHSQISHCPKCEAEVKGDQNSLCRNCA